jgi:hypothetical protein
MQSGLPDNGVQHIIAKTGSLPLQKRKSPIIVRSATIKQFYKLEQTVKHHSPCSGFSRAHKDVLPLTGKTRALYGINEDRCRFDASWPEILCSSESLIYASNRHAEQVISKWG